MTRRELTAEMRGNEETCMRASSMMEVGNPCSLKNEDISDVLEWNLILGADAA